MLGLISVQLNSSKKLEYHSFHKQYIAHQSGIGKKERKKFHDFSNNKFKLCCRTIGGWGSIKGLLTPNGC